MLSALTWDQWLALVSLMVAFWAAFSLMRSPIKREES